MSLSIAPDVQKRLLDLAMIDRLKDPERAELTFVLIFRALRMYDRMRGTAEDAPLPHQKAKEAKAATKALGALLKDVREIERLTVSWGTGGRDLRDPMSPQQRSVWSMVADRYHVAQDAGPMPVFPLPWIDGLEYPFDLNVLAMRLDQAVRLDNDLLRRMVHGLLPAISETLGLLAAKDSSSRHAPGQGQKRGTSTRNRLVHQLGKIFNFVHAAKRRREAPAVRKVKDGASSVHRRAEFIVLVLRELAGERLALRSVDNVLDADLIARGRNPDGTTTEIISLKVEKPPSPSDRSWADLLRVLRRPRRGVELQPFFDWGLEWLMMFDYEDPESFDGM